MTEPLEAQARQGIAITRAFDSKSKMGLEPSNDDDDPQQEEEDLCAIKWKPFDKLQTFSLQLMEEFLTQYQLDDTLNALRTELKDKGVARFNDRLWLEMHQSCHVALTQERSKGDSTLEKLLAFCVSPHAATKGAGPLALKIATPPVTKNLSKRKFSLHQAYNQMLSPVIRPSQRHRQHESCTKMNLSTSATASSTERVMNARPSPLAVVTTAERVESNQRSSFAMKKRKPKKHRHGNDTNASQLLHPARSESSSLTSYDEQVKRDLSCGRLLAREFRALRIEHVKYDSIRRGIASFDASHDPYTNELVRERYGFIHRVECALCAFPFLHVNLPYQVSFKCIMDLQNLWGYAPPQRELAARYRPPFCYDIVSVCRMCGPILFHLTTATPNAFHDQQHLSPAMGPNTHTAKTKSECLIGKSESSDRRPFCSDPYALPPLFGDDVTEVNESHGSEDTTNEMQRNNGVGAVQESPAKAIVYSQQQADTVAFMSSKEWEIIKPARSNIRQVMESTIKR